MFKHEIEYDRDFSQDIFYTSLEYFNINKQLLLEPDFLYFPYENIWFELIEYFFDLKLSSIKLDNFTLEMAEEKSWEKFIFNEE